MALYTAQESFTFGTVRESRVIIVTGEVAFEAYNGAEWVADGNSPLLTGNYEIVTQGVRARFTPEVGGTFWIDEDSQK